MKNNLLNPLWRINNLYTVTDKDGNNVKFKLRSAQKHYIENKHTRNIILKSRQLGFTTLKGMLGLDRCIFDFEKVYNGLVIAHTEDFAKKIFTDKIRFAYDNFDNDLKQYIQKVSDTDRVLKLSLSEEKNHQNSIAVSVSARAGTYNDIHITELSTVDQNEPIKAREIISGAIPALSFDGELTIESTAKQNFGLFHDIFMRAYEMKDRKLTNKDFKFHFYNWQWDEYELSKITDETINIISPQLTQEFKDYQRQHQLTDKEIACYFMFWKACDQNFDILQQEYPTTIEEAFTAGSDLVFDVKKLNDYKTIAGRKQNDWTYYEDPKPNNTYVIGADVAEGIERDYSTIVILNVTGNFEDEKIKVAATYKSNIISPTNFAYEVQRAARMYNDAYCGVERNNHGNATIGKLLEIYPHELIHIARRFKNAEEFETDKYGWETNSLTKSMMINQINDAINQELIELNSRDLIMELKTYPKEDINRMKHKSGVTTHWDMVIALSISYQMRRFVTNKAQQEHPIFVNVGQLDATKYF